MFSQLAHNIFIYYYGLQLSLRLRIFDCLSLQNLDATPTDSLEDAVTTISDETTLKEGALDMYISDDGLNSAGCDLVTNCLY